jgi:diguanylate cyclase (GGDEF)-like protein/PAS domain S-box-containing protein
MQGVRSLFKRFCISVSIAVLAVSIAFYNQYVHFVSLGDLVLDEKSVVGGVLPTILVSVLVLGAMCFLLVRFFIAPLARLSEGVSQVDAENLSAYRLPVSGTGEFAAVARKINCLIDKAGSYMSELEQKVDERTQEFQAANQELIAMNEELTAMNEEIASLNQNLSQMNDTLEIRVADRTAELSAALKMQAVLRDIAEVAVHEAPLEEVFKKVHQLVELVLPAKNFYISLLDETGDHFVRPYCADETGRILRQRRVGGGGLTDYVLQQGRAVFISPDDLSRLQQRGELTSARANYSGWMGVPLIDSSDRFFGTISAFSVGEETKALQKSDLEALTIIAAQVSQAIERHRTASDLRESEERFRLAMEFSGTGYLDVDLAQRSLLLSENWRQRIGFLIGETILPWDEYILLVHPEDAERRQRSLDSYLQGTRPIHETEYRLGLPDGSWIWVLARFKAVRDEAGTPIRLLGTLSDITELKRREQRERHRAEHDELTGTLNRQGLTVKAANIFAGKTGGALALINIDDFDLINAVHGRDVGDEYLLEFARFLRSKMDEKVHIARFGGDEFILLFSGPDGVQQARDAFAAMDSVEIQTRAGGFHVHISCGIADCPTTTGGALDWLVQQADLALKHAKEQGKRRFRCFEPSMLEAIRRRHAIHEQLNQALAQNELYLVYQPIFDIRRDPADIVGYEALLRWNSPVLGSVPPLEFISVAESTKLILQIGKWVLEEACRFSARWQQQKGVFAPIAVNLSAIQLAQPDFGEQVRTILDQTGVPAEALHLEVTESVLMTDLEQNAAILSTLRDWGIGISLDDFGTGYSSFTYLAKLPITTLKIDKSLIDGISDERESKNQPLLKSVLHLADQLGHEVVVEGVESAEQLRAIKAMGFRYCQGFLLARPELEQIVSAKSD